MSTKKADQLWRYEHPKANVPAIVSNHAELEDVSWHNDVMPSFQRKGWQEKQDDAGTNVDLRLWVDYADQADSEFADEPDWSRYCVWSHDSDNSDEPVILYKGDDVKLAISALLAATNEPSEAPAATVGH